MRLTTERVGVSCSFLTHTEMAPAAPCALLCGYAKRCSLQGGRGGVARKGLEAFALKGALPLSLLREDLAWFGQLLLRAAFLHACRGGYMPQVEHADDDDGDAPHFRLRCVRPRGVAPIGND